MSRLANNEPLSNNNFRFHNLYLVIHGTPYREFIDFGTGKTFAVTATNIYSLAHLITLRSVFVLTTDKTNTYSKRSMYILTKSKIRI